jgi:hypothetical protein
MVMGNPISAGIPQGHRFFYAWWFCIDLTRKPAGWFYGRVTLGWLVRFIVDYRCLTATIAA